MTARTFFIEKVAPKSACCARCVRPMGEEQFKFTRYTYGACCIKQVEEEQSK